MSRAEKNLLFVFIFAAACSFTPKVLADSHPNAADAAAHCDSIAALPQNDPCDCVTYAAAGITANDGDGFADINPNNGSGCGFPNVHAFTSDCSSDTYNDITYPDGASLICADNCGYTSGPGVTMCFPSSGTCIGPITGTGNPCTISNAATTPSGCSIGEDNSVTCDCAANPSAPFCPGGSDPNEDECFYDPIGDQVACYSEDDPTNPNNDPDNSGGEDDEFTGDNDGGGDGDPDTPGNNDGTGDGDIDDDGNRDVDCNPLSNPDCAFTGSASAVSHCGAAPVCSGDPVQCAILVQQYNTMCAVLTAAEKDNLGNSATASGDCDVEPVCVSKDPVQCGLIKQQWLSTCSMVDVGSELAPWQVGSPDYADYNRDLADESSDVDVSGGMDQSGLGTGSCPAPIAFSMMGHSMDVDMQPICDIAGIVRVFVILMTLMWAGSYIVRSF